MRRMRCGKDGPARVSSQVAGQRCRFIGYHRISCQRVLASKTRADRMDRGQNRWLPSDCPQNASFNSFSPPFGFLFWFPWVSCFFFEPTPTCDPSLPSGAAVPAAHGGVAGRRRGSEELGWVWVAWRGGGLKGGFPKSTEIRGACA